jgi:topoisomerase-4 subunit A
MTVSDVVRHHAKRLLAILKAELELEIRELQDEMHARTLERIFIEERVYKAIETKKTQAAVDKAVIDGLLPFAAEIKREVTSEDVERLLRIPIRRISLYDIEKARAEMERLLARLKEAKHHLAHLIEYGIGFLDGLIKKLAPVWARKTKITSFGHVDAKEVARRDISLRYDPQSGYLGTTVTGGEFQFDVSPFDKILVVRRSGIYSVVPVPEKLFVDKGMFYCGIAEKEMLADIIFSIVYLDPKNGCAYIKRCSIDAWIMNKDYQLAPEGTQVLFFTAESKKAFIVTWAPKPRFKINTDRYKVESFLVKGLKAQGVRLSTRHALSAQAEGEKGLFDSVPQPASAGAVVIAKAKPRKKTSTKVADKPVKKQATKPKARAAGKIPADKPSPKATAPVMKSPAQASKTGEKAGIKGGLLEKATARKKPPKG